MYRMAIIRRRLLRFFGTDPYTSALPITSHEPPPQDLLDFLPTTFDPDRFRNATLPYSEFGLLWSSMILKGQKALHSWSPHLDISYEALVASPIDELQKIEDFLHLAPNSEWLAASAPAFHGRGDSWLLLAQDDRDELTRSCRLGMDILFGRGAWRTA